MTAPSIAADVSEIPAGPPRLRAIIALVGPFALALGYLWGVIYQDVRMEAWGFHSYAVPLAPAEVYVQAFLAISSMAQRPVEWLSGFPLWSMAATVVGVLLLGGLVGGLVSTQWWRQVRARRRSTSSPKPPHPALIGALTGLWALLIIPLMLSLLSAVVVSIVAPPLYAARADAERAWKQRSFEKWDKATWTSSDGQQLTGYVHSCMGDVCALLTADGRAHIVARERVGDRTNRSTYSASSGEGTAD